MLQLYRCYSVAIASLVKQEREDGIKVGEAIGIVGGVPTYVAFPLHLDVTVVPLLLGRHCLAS